MNSNLVLILELSSINLVKSSINKNSSINLKLTREAVLNKNCINKIRQDDFFQGCKNQNDSISKVLYSIKKVATNHKVAFAQSMLETGWLKSKIFYTNKNLFGMKKAYIRNHVQTGENDGYATYSKFEDSVVDYCMWQKHMGYNKRIKNYAHTIAANGYSESKIYSKLLSGIINCKKSRNFLN